MSNKISENTKFRLEHALTDVDAANEMVSALNLKANLDSPAFTGTPTAPTPPLNDNSTKLATTEYVDSAVGAGVVYPLNAPAGSLSAPSINFQDNDSGFFQNGDGNISVVANGILNTEFNQNDITFKRNVFAEGDLAVTGNISAANYPPTGNANFIAQFNNSGELVANSDQGVNNFNGINISASLDFDNRGGGQAYNNSYLPFRPLQNSNSESWNVNNFMVDIDPDKDGFDMGAGAQWGSFYNLYFRHFGTSDIGSLTFFKCGL